MIWVTILHIKSHEVALAGLFYGEKLAMGEKGEQLPSYAIVEVANAIQESREQEGENFRVAVEMTQAAIEAVREANAQNESESVALQRVRTSINRAVLQRTSQLQYESEYVAKGRLKEDEDGREIEEV